MVLFDFECILYRDVYMHNFMGLFMNSKLSSYENKNKVCI